MLDNRTDFFSVGRPKPKVIENEIEETKDWKDIKPRQEYDALNKQVFKKRKFEEFQALKAQKAEKSDRSIPFNSGKRFKKNDGTVI